MTDLKKLDNVSKAIIVVLVAVASYFIIFIATTSLLAPEQPPMARMMNDVMGTSIAGFSATTSIVLNLFSIVLALIAGFMASSRIFGEAEKKSEYEILRKALSEDEKKIMDEIKRAGEITQDSLRFRLGWSKAKVSTMLTNLDRRNLIQRERLGKTYKVYLHKIK